MNRLMLKESSNPQEFFTEAGSGVGKSTVSDDVINQVDQFLRDALLKPPANAFLLLLSCKQEVTVFILFFCLVLRLEQDVEKFISDPTQQQLEFQQLPTSYLRLAAHRVAHHYSLQSMVLLENSLPDGSGSRIIVRKTPECRRPPIIRLADIPVNLQSEDSSVVKVAIIQRPQKKSQFSGNSGLNSSKSNSSRSVEERKEEYNRARARIFNSSSSSGGKPESEPRLNDASFFISKVEEKKVSGVYDMNSCRGLMDSSSSCSRPVRNSVENDLAAQPQQYNRIAIFRDRESDRKDPDYDRSYDRYMQRFDLGFNFSGGPYSIQPIYVPAVNYNTEFSQLGVNARSQISNEVHHRPLPQHLPGSWAGPLNPAGIGYGHLPDAMMTPFSPNHVGAHSSAIYMHPSQFPCQHPGIPYIQHHEHLHQQFLQSHQQQVDASFGFARSWHSELRWIGVDFDQLWQPCFVYASTLSFKLGASSIINERGTAIIWMNTPRTLFHHLC
ncbi:hypothetical protein ACFE04_009547 [Oxalis oulophora]